MFVLDISAQHMPKKASRTEQPHVVATTIKACLAFIDRVCVLQS